MRTPSAAQCLCGAAVFASAVSGLEQEVLASSSAHKLDSTGVLYRFALNANASETFWDVAQEHDLDVWLAHDQYANIYFPHLDAYSSSVDALESISTSHEPQSIPLNFDASLHVPFEDWSSLQFLNSTFHDSYHPLYELDEFTRSLVELYPDLLTVEDLGHSAAGGREMIGLKVSRPSETDEIKPAFVIAGASHAREWVAITTALYLTHALVATDSPYTDLLDSFDFYIVPVPNPDGYVYSWESDRFWYKNRQVMGANAKCVGLDMNRNWGYKWKSHAGGSPVFRGDEEEEDNFRGRKPGKTPKPPVSTCSHFFPGHRPFESPEVNGIANWMTTLPRLEAFVDLRAYGQMLSIPYSYTCRRSPKDAEDQIEAAMGAAHAARNVHGENYDIGSLCDLLYPAPGNMMDWMYKIRGVKYAYSAHLRDTGTYGFALPAQQIRPVGEETAGMVKYLIDFMVRKGV